MKNAEVVDESNEYSTRKAGFHMETLNTNSDAILIAKKNKHGKHRLEWKF